VFAPPDAAASIAIVDGTILTFFRNRVLRRTTGRL
jgi:hypothetical protein